MGNASHQRRLTLLHADRWYDLKPGKRAYRFLACFVCAVLLAYDSFLFFLGGCSAEGKRGR